MSYVYIYKHARGICVCSLLLLYTTHVHRPGLVERLGQMPLGFEQYGGELAQFENPLATITSASFAFSSSVPALTFASLLFDADNSFRDCRSSFVTSYIDAFTSLHLLLLCAIFLDLLPGILSASSTRSKGPSELARKNRHCTTCAQTCTEIPKVMQTSAPGMLSAHCRNCFKNMPPHVLLSFSLPSIYSPPRA